MSAEWYLIGSPQIYNGGFEGEEFHAYAQDGFQEVLDTSMLCDEVEFINSDFSVITPGKAIIQSVTPDTQLKSEDRQILVPIGTLQSYSYIRFEDNIWIIASEPSNNKFYEKCVLKICNNQLRWQDKDTNQIHSYWYWCEDTTKYSSGVFKGKVVVTYDKQYGLMLPLDQNTRKLHDGMRFMLEMSDDIPLVYKLTKFDGLTGNNKNAKLLKLSLTQTVYNDRTDNIDLMIADYKKDTSESYMDDYKCKITYDSDSIRLSSFGKFVASFYDNDNSPIDGIEYRWEVSSDEFDINDLVLTTGDNFVKVKVKNNPDLVGKKFRLNVVKPDDVKIISDNKRYIIDNYGNMILTNTILASVVIAIDALW